MFRDLSKLDLLKKCVHGKTQNPNESFNSCVWERVPKTIFVSSDTLKMGVMDAVLTYNDGNINKVKVLEKIGCINSKNTIMGLKRLDEIRIMTAESAAENFTRESRKRKRSDRRSLQDEENNESDPEYGAGLH